jgi:hypothetical protein
MADGAIMVLASINGLVWHVSQVKQEAKSGRRVVLRGLLRTFVPLQPTYLPPPPS